MTGDPLNGCDRSVAYDKTTKTAVRFPSGGDSNAATPNSSALSPKGSQRRYRSCSLHVSITSRVESIDEALAALAEHGGDARILAGGQSLIPAMRFRLARPALLVDINPLDELAYIREDGGMLRIGARTRDSELERWRRLGRYRDDRRCERRSSPIP